MGENEYKISLGVDLDDGSISDIQRQVNGFESKLDPIKIKVEIENLTDIKKQIQNLGGTKGKAQIGIPIDTASLESSLKDVSAIIRDIKASIGTLDNKSGMKSLLSSINQISSALEKASDQFTELNANINALSGKDLSLNFGINLGSNNQIARNAAYGSKVRGETLPQLKQQVNELVKYYNAIHKTSYNEMESLSRLVSGTKLGTGDFFSNFLFGNDSVASRMNGGSLSAQMQAYKEFIDMFQKAASLKGLDLSGVTSGFSKAADDLIKDAQDIQTGAKEMDESFDKLKQIFGGGVNVEGLSETLKPIIEDLNSIRKSVDDLSNNASLEGLTQSFDRLSDTLEKLMNNAQLVQSVLGDGLVNSVSDNGAERAAQEQKELAQTSTQTANTVVQNEEKKQQAYQETADAARNLDNVSIDISEGNVDSLKNALKNLKVDDSSIENATKELTEMNVVAKSVSGTLKEGNLIRWDIKGIQTTEDGLERVVTITKTLGNEGWSNSIKYAQSFDKIAAAAKNIRDKLSDTGSDGFGAELQRAHTEANKFTASSGELSAALQRLDNAMDAINSADEANDVQRLVAANKEYEEALKLVYSQIKLNQQAERDSISKESLNLQKKALHLDIDKYLNDNTKAARLFGDELRRLQREIDACDDSGALGNLKKQFQGIKKEADSTLKSTKSLGDRIKQQWQQYSTYLSVASLVSYATQGLRDMFRQVVAIDTAMTELKKVTDETDASYNKFLSNAAKRSKELGTTIDGLVTSTADFARLGYGFEESQGLAEVANIYAVVGDEIGSVEDATKSLISTLAAFKDEASGISDDDFAMDIIDKFNEVSNNFAISSGGIGEAMQRSASSLRAANNTIDESVALITAANTVVQDPTSVGRFMPTLKVAISVKLQRWTRPRKDFISIF